METGLIMDGVNSTKELQEKNKIAKAAINNESQKQLEQMINQYKNSHTPKVREFKKIGRNELCPCGSGKKYKNCCLKTGKYENLILQNKRGN